MNDLKVLEFRSKQAIPYAEAIAKLRIGVFAEWPYLYSGDIDYELKYLKNYFSSENSFIALALDGDRVVGASTAIWLPDAEEAFRRPFTGRGIDVETVCYYGESILLQNYRGHGIGGRFMKGREAFARSLPKVQRAAFCSVIRPDDHPMKPAAYKPLYDFWRNVGFVPVEGMVAYFSWKDHGEREESKKPLQFWLKELKKE